MITSFDMKVPSFAEVAARILKDIDEERLCNSQLTHKVINTEISKLYKKLIENDLADKEVTYICTFYICKLTALLIANVPED